MRPFDIEEAKAGKPVVTRDGHKVRLFAYDIRGPYPVLGVCTLDDQEEYPYDWTEKGMLFIGDETAFDLMMED